MNVLIWFKRDLRCQHHPGLNLACQMGRVLPLYIVEPDYWRLPDTSGRQWAFTAECLTELRDDLAALGAPLIVRTGDAVECLESLCRKHHIARIISHEETGNAWCEARDSRVAEWCKNAGIEWLVLPNPSIADQSTAEEADKRQTQLVAVAGPEPGPIPTPKSLKLLEDSCPHRQTGGRSQALFQMQSFLDVRAVSYLSNTASPLVAERACSRLSPHLAMGTVAACEVSGAISQRLADRPGGVWTKSLGKFQRQLALREQALATPDAQLLVALHRKHAFAPAANSGFLDQRADAYSAWCAGLTGLPFLDACMRYLAATGWLNFAARAFVLQAASFWLGIDATQSALYLARCTTDYEPRVHWAQVLAILGPQTAEFGALQHPINRGMKLDPDGAFIRRWLPELALIPAEFSHAPWKHPGFHAIAGRRYPAPLLQLTVSPAAHWGAKGVVQRITTDVGATRSKALTKRAGNRTSYQKDVRGKPRPTAQLALDI